MHNYRRRRQDRKRNGSAERAGCPSSDGTGGILRITQDGEPVIDPNTGDHILGSDYPLNLYYAYGIRNSFGIDFDPVSGYLWDSENGPGHSDEINRVEPGFNSGVESNNGNLYSWWRRS